jgi:hypothetical protein
MSDTTSLERTSVRDRSKEADNRIGSKVSVKVRFLPPRLLPHFLRPLSSKLTNGFKSKEMNWPSLVPELLTGIRCLLHEIDT